MAGIVMTTFLNIEKFELKVIYIIDNRKLLLMRVFIDLTTHNTRVQ